MRAPFPLKNPVSLVIRIWPASVRPHANRPETTEGRLGGRLYTVRHWTAKQWAQTPEAERPDPALPGDRGGWFSVEATPN